MGSSNNHPHGQIWAGSFLPNLPMRKDENQRVREGRMRGTIENCRSIMKSTDDLFSWIILRRRRRRKKESS